MIYIASPFSHPDAAVRQARYEAAYRYAKLLMAQGVTCFSPIVYGYQFYLRGDAQEDFKFWQSFNDHMLLTSTEVHVLQLEGVKESAGVRHECELAFDHGIRVKAVKEARIENL